MPATAIPCTVGSCRRVTRDASGRCHDHRRASSAPAKNLPSPPKLDDGPVRSTKGRDDGGHIEIWKAGKVFHRIGAPAVVNYSFDGVVLTEAYYEWGVSKRSDGPAFISFRRDGSVDYEEWRTGLKGERSRVGGPAVTEYYDDGSWREATWYHDGSIHRVDGPARQIRKADGTKTTSSYRLDGGYVAPEGFAAKLREYSPDRIRDEFERSSYAELLEEGIEPAAIIDAIAADVWTVEGVREVAGGAPAEWVRSYEKSVTE